jgi:hypothetical protein
LLADSQGRISPRRFIGVGVDRERLDDRGGALDNFTRSDAIRDGFGEDAYAAHEAFVFSLKRRTERKIW